MYYEEWSSRFGGLKIEDLAKWPRSFEEKTLMFAGIVVVINSLTRGKVVIRRAYREILWGVFWNALEGKVGPWRQVDKDLGPFALTTTRGRGRQRKLPSPAELRAAATLIGKHAAKKLARKYGSTPASIRTSLSRGKTSNK